MRTPLSILLAFTITLASHAQQKPDSLTENTSSTTTLLDTDSLNRTLQQLPDSLLPSFHSIDSIRQHFNATADSLQRDYQAVLTGIDKETRNINNALDSAAALNLPTGKYTARLDSMNSLRLDASKKFTARLQDLKSKTTSGLNSLDLPPEYQEPLNQLTTKINTLNLDAEIVTIPDFQIPGYAPPDINAGNLVPNAGDVGNVNSLAKLPELETPIGNLGQLSEQTSAYKQDIQNLTQGNIKEVKQIPQAIESQASRIDGMDELQKQSGIIDEHKASLGDLGNSEKAKEKAVAIGKKAATDHFAGKQEQLKTAMDKLSKYKQKYSSVSSIKDLPKRPPNAMKGKPVIERLVPGVYLQYQQKTFYLIDVNPFVGYKISGRFISGLGWNHRYAYDKNRRAFTSRARIFGPRAYVDFKLGKGFIAHVEGEAMNTFVPSVLTGNPDNGGREWVWGIMTGMKKEYKIYKNLKGTALIQYNLFNRLYKAPYVDRLNSRIGFEYTLKKGKKKVE